MYTSVFIILYHIYSIKKIPEIWEMCVCKYIISILNIFWYIYVICHALSLKGFHVRMIDLMAQKVEEAVENQVESLVEKVQRKVRKIKAKVRVKVKAKNLKVVVEKQKGKKVEKQKVLVKKLGVEAKQVARKKVVERKVGRKGKRRNKKKNFRSVIKNMVCVCGRRSKNKNILHAHTISY